MTAGQTETEFASRMPMRLSQRALRPQRGEEARQGAYGELREKLKTRILAILREGPEA